MTSLEQALLDRTKLSADDLKSAEGRRAEMGGRLETALLELGLLTETDLAPALAAHYNLPAATVADLDNIPESVHSLLSSEQASVYGAIPFAAAPGRVDLAVAASLNLEKADELAFLLGRRVRLFVLNEVRVAQALHRRYGQPQPARLLNLADRLERGLGPSRDLASEPVSPTTTAPQTVAGSFGEFGAGPRRPGRQRPQGVIRRITPSKPREERRSVALSDQEREAIFGVAPVPPEASDPEMAQVPASDLAQLSHELQAAASPTAVGEAFLAYLATFFDTAVLLRPEGQMYCGWLALGSEVTRDEVRQLMTGPTLSNEWRDLSGDEDLMSYCLGASSVAVGLPEALDAEAESMVSLVPVRVQERIVCLAVCAPERHLSRNETELLGNASLRAGLALQGWILRHKSLPNKP